MNEEGLGLLDLYTPEEADRLNALLRDPRRRVGCLPPSFLETEKHTLADKLREAAIPQVAKEGDWYTIFNKCTKKESFTFSN